MTKKDYIKFTKLFAKAIKNNDNTKDNINISNTTDIIIGTLIDDTIKYFEENNPLFEETIFRSEITIQRSKLCDINNN